MGPELRLGQIGPQNAPGDAVDRQMVNHQEQPSGFFARRLLVGEEDLEEGVAAEAAFDG